MGDRLLPYLGNLTYGQMREAVSALPITVGSALLQDPLQGLYDESTQTIVIDRSCIYVQKRCVLMHELIHWQHGDCSCDSLSSIKEEKRARRETALALINPHDYALAESMYEGDVYCIACDLEVTTQVVLDYQAHLDNHL